MLKSRISNILNINYLRINFQGKLLTNNLRDHTENKGSVLQVEKVAFKTFLILITSESIFKVNY